MSNLIPTITTELPCEDSLAACHGIHGIHRPTSHSSHPKTSGSMLQAFPPQKMDEMDEMDESKFFFLHPHGLFFESTNTQDTSNSNRQQSSAFRTSLFLRPVSSQWWVWISGLPCDGHIPKCIDLSIYVMFGYVWVWPSIFIMAIILTEFTSTHYLAVRLS